LKATLDEFAQALDADVIIEAGSTKMRDIDQLLNLLKAYSGSVSRTFFSRDGYGFGRTNSQLVDGMEGCRLDISRIMDSYFLI
jgi:hypothetical protein